MDLKDMKTSTLYKLKKLKTLLASKEDTFEDSDIFIDQYEYVKFLMSDAGYMEEIDVIRLNEIYRTLSDSPKNKDSYDLVQFHTDINKDNIFEIYIDKEPTNIKEPYRVCLIGKNKHEYKATYSIEYLDKVFNDRRWIKV
jgi:hypothetical protein